MKSTMDERDWWIELDNRINTAEANGIKDVSLTYDETREIIDLLKRLDEMVN